jgi:Outer membrane protein beta-barrel domain
MRMLIPAAVCGFVLMTSAPVWAQAGVLVGANFAKLDVSGEGDAPEADRRIGLVAGVFATMRMGDLVSIQPEVQYSQKGEKFTEDSVDVTIELDYLDIPVLARFTGSSRSGLVVFGGPSFGFKLRARSTFDIEDEEIEDEDLGDDVESFDLGFIAGAGIESEKFFVDGRYQWGLSNINATEDDQEEIKNRVLSVVVGFRF